MIMAQQSTPPEQDKAPEPDEQQPASPKQEGHGGVGSESVMRLLRLWEQRRASSRSTSEKDKPDKGN